VKIFILLLATILTSTSLYGQQHNSIKTIVVHKKTFIVKTEQITEEQVLLTVNHDSKTILSDKIDAGGLTKLKFIDFDKDGNKDIFLTYMGNNFTYQLYLFDKTKNNFKFVKGFDRFPEAIQLKSNPKYYYSYSRAGCADLNWVSDLFYIDNFKTIHIGHIDGQGCDFEVQNNPQVIEIFKIKDNTEKKMKLINKLPYLKFVPNFGDKWDFMKKYWNANYLKFQ
jgi:hypothetical protein